MLKLMRMFRSKSQENVEDVPGVEPQVSEVPTSPPAEDVERTKPKNKRRKRKRPKAKMKGEAEPVQPFDEKALARLGPFIDFRHVTPELFYRRLGIDEQAARTWLRRMGEKKYLKSWELVRNRKYWTLSKKAIDVLNAEHGLHLSPRYSRVPARMFPDVHGFYVFCTPSNGPKLERCRPCTLASEFPDVHAKFVNATAEVGDGKKRGPVDPLHQHLFYQRPNGVVGLFRAFHNEADYAKKVLQRKTKWLMMTYPSFLERSRVGAFELTVAASSEDEKKHLDDQIEALKQPPPFECKVICLEELRDARELQQRAEREKGKKTK